MKLIIDIPEEEYNLIKKQVLENITNPLKVCIANGTPYEEGKNEKKQGEWVEESSETGALGIKYTWFKCNQCGWNSSLVIPRNFCPNCGADMRKGGAE